MNRPQSTELHYEKVEMYKKSTKMELIGMLISSNLHLEAVTKQLNKPVVVRGGDSETESVPRKESQLANAKFNITPNTPTEPLPAEALAKNGSDGEMCRFARDKRCECEVDRECTLM